MMPPPPRPVRPPPTLAPFPAVNSVQRAGPLPSRQSPRSSSRKVLLEPGHSPLDWARLSGPGADLRGLPSGTPLLRVSSSELRAHTGRRGKDAWMALDGKVYNVSSYARFHPGGVPEMMRGAARDASALFRDVHPWVNYEAMLSACLIGLLVDGPRAESEMDAMD
ncbi:hypothetical protein CDD80_4673 [Ophiocordyceps camponoti-rufipedis]|uniref:Cytochrome b5 heme-binding domain-containing protein n=1 Tax=Ophiocordyceps camponoti-rufipedis TaxID=2004952 RepID=A0A2C5YTV8_9HYPO|nr:hypothetical protein CDD80_4673 [Ophiocordyceps camponoti-rufipedis]